MFIIRTRQSTTRLKQARKNLKAAVHEAKNKCIKSLYASLNTNIGTKSAWDATKHLKTWIFKSQTIVFQADETPRWFFTPKSYLPKAILRRLQPLFSLLEYYRLRKVQITNDNVVRGIRQRHFYNQNDFKKEETAWFEVRVLFLDLVKAFDLLTTPSNLSIFPYFDTPVIYLQILFCQVLINPSAKPGCP